MESNKWSVIIFLLTMLFFQNGNCGTTRSPWRTTWNPWRTTWSPWRTTWNPWRTTWNPWRTTWSPWRTTWNQWRTTWSPWRTTWNPWRTTRNPWRTTRNPWRTTWNPWRTTRNLWRTTWNPWRTTRNPWRTTWNPWRTTWNPWRTTWNPWQTKQDCDFRRGLWSRYCPWGNVNYNGHDDFHWNVKMNSKRGAYVYVRSPVNAGKKKSRLVSDYFDNSIKCLKFSYRVTGAYDEIGLKIYQQAALKRKILRWSQSKRKTSEWLDGEVTMSYIKSSSNYRIIVEGDFETYSYGEIDIGKLSLKSGSCYNGSSKSAKNIGIIIGSVGAALLLFIVVVFLIYYFCYKKYKRNSTANPTNGVMNQVYSSHEDTMMTDLPPPSFESVCNLPPAYTIKPLGKVNLGTEAK